MVQMFQQKPRYVVFPGHLVFRTSLHGGLWTEIALSMQLQMFLLLMQYSSPRKTETNLEPTQTSKTELSMKTVNLWYSHPMFHASGLLRSHSALYYLLELVMTPYLLFSRIYSESQSKGDEKGECWKTETKLSGYNLKMIG